MRGWLPMLTLLLSVIPFARAAPLAEGSVAPDFEVTAVKAGVPFTYHLQQALHDGPVVLYFYPSAFTQGCNLQAHTFATRMAEFRAAHATVLGVSLDSVERLQRFSQDPDFCAGALAVASDGSGALARRFAVPVRDLPDGKRDTQGALIDHGLAERITYVLGADSRVVRTIAGEPPAAQVEAALREVQRLANSLYR